MRMTEGLAPSAMLPLPANSRAVLIGVSQYEHESLEALPAVEANLASLNQLLTDPDLWGLPTEHCVTLLNPGSGGEVLDAVHTAAVEATDGLVVYYAGHGLLDDRSELYLALSHSDKKRIFHGIRYDDVRREVVHTARKCNAKVVILDCCFSGRALQGGMSGPTEVANHASIAGTYLMTASAETSVALAPIGEKYTAFTGALVDNLANGLPDGPDLLDMETLFFHVRAKMQERNFPIPQQRTRNDGRSIAIARNRRGPAGSMAQSVRPTKRLLPPLPAGTESLLRPREISNHVAELRHEDHQDEAGALLGAVGAHHRDQAVAALIEVLHAQGRPGDVALVIDGAALRPPGEVVAIISALRETDMPEQAHKLLATVAHRPVDEAAALAQQLQAQEDSADLTTLLDNALVQAQQAGSMIGLVNALWLAGLRNEVDQLLHRTATHLPEQDVLALADELRSAGREQAAFGLYVAAADGLARRPAETIAQLVGAMTDAEYATGSARVAAAAIEACNDPASVLALSGAFRTAGQDRHAEATLHHAANSLPDLDIVAVADQLLKLGQDEAALHLCITAALRRPATSTRMFVDALREAGRPVDAKYLLGLAAEQLVLAEAVELISSVAADGRVSDLARILDGAAQRAPDDAAALAAALLHHGGAAEAAQLVARIATLHREHVGGLLTAVNHLDDPRLAELASAAVLQNLTAPEAAALLRSLAPDEGSALFITVVQTGEPLLGPILEALHAVAGAAPAHDPVLSLLRGHPPDRLEPLLVALRRNGLDRYAETLLARAKGAPKSIDELAVAIQALRAYGDNAEVDRLLHQAMPNQPVLGLRDLILTLHRHNLTAEVGTVLEWIRTNCEASTVARLSDMLRRANLPRYVDALAIQ
jgi:hypothetical protein